MSLRVSDGKLACIAAVGLLALAATVVIAVLPGGFETQVGWFLILLPGAFAAYPLSDYVYRVAPHAESVMLWVSMASFNFLWYWIVSFVVIKIRRALD